MYADSLKEQVDLKRLFTLVGPMLVTFNCVKNARLGLADETVRFHTVLLHVAWVGT